MSPRVIQLPLSGRDRRHYVNELRKAELHYASVVKQADAAHVAAVTASTPARLRDLVYAAIHRR